MTAADQRYRALLSTWAKAAPLRSNRAMEWTGIVVFLVAFYDECAGLSVAASAGLTFSFLLIHLSLALRLDRLWIDQDIATLTSEPRTTLLVAGLGLDGFLLGSQATRLVFLLLGVGS